MGFTQGLQLHVGMVTLHAVGQVIRHGGQVRGLCLRDLAPKVLVKGLELKGLEFRVEGLV